jgi:hypothetical protein
MSLISGPSNTIGDQICVTYLSVAIMVDEGDTDPDSVTYPRGDVLELEIGRFEKGICSVRRKNYFVS